MMLSGRTQEREIYARLDTASPSQLGGLIWEQRPSGCAPSLAFPATLRQHSSRISNDGLSTQYRSVNSKSLARWSGVASASGSIRTPDLFEADRSILHDP